MAFTAPDDYIFNKFGLDKNHRYGNLISHSNVRFIGDEARARRMLTFLREHYDADTTMTVEASLATGDPDEPISVYRYTSAAKATH